MKKFLAFSLLAVLFLGPFSVFGEKIDELQIQISDKNKQIQELEEEIVRLQNDIDRTEKDADSLKKQISVINATISKLSKDISVARRKIEAAELNLETLGIEISAQKSSIAELGGGLAELIRGLYEAESQSLIEVMLARASISDFFQDVDYMQGLSSKMQKKLLEFKEAKEKLETEKIAEESVKKQLTELNSELQARRNIEQGTKSQKDVLLKTTKNKEAEYQRLLVESQAARAAFETELFELESALRIVIDPSSIPPAKQGILSWPVKNIFITQGYGLTDFARTGAYGYTKGQPNPHRGIDLRASLGTPIFSAFSGVVRGWGNTDAVPNCYSVGKWVLVDHPNGLATVYSHLSQISVSKGQEIKTGEVVGYSGYSGYTKPPGPAGSHLHFSVFAKQGVQILNIRDWYKQNDIAPTTACAKGGAILPVAPPEAHLNPLNYL
ncbi:MAG: peptidoglycan DD-metalloendopeptidase family protein [Candidatus Niyogibacteria bacterium]|nr:peptidoglycan DD-metalloendopeptidase family protein [Candidatus Niyogibacteria bacterium]